MCMNLRNMAAVQSVVHDKEVKDIVPVIDDISDFETLCPISSVTGHRMNPLDALQMVLNPSKARLVEQVLQELPASGVPSDVGTFEFIVSRLDCGTDAERSLYCKRLEAAADVIYNIRPDLRPQEEIKFDESDKQTNDE